MTPPWRRRAGTACLLALTTAAATPARAQWFDPYRTRALATATPAAPQLHGLACEPALAARALELQDVMLQAICAHPQARQAWAEARARAAALGVARAAYLPTLNAIVGVGRDTLATTYDYPGLGLSITGHQNTSNQYTMLNLSWVLFDFGKRRAALRQAHELLATADAAQDDALQTVLFGAAQAYYAVRDAQASLEAARRTETVARESLAETSAKHAAGAGTLSDQLQAQTTYRRALLERVDAEGEARAASGTLAAAMGLDANTPVRIAAAQDDAGPDAPAYLAGIDRLIDEAKARQPKLIVARARLDAARANVDAVRAQGRPTVSLVGSLSNNNPSYQQPQGPESPSMRDTHASSIGVQVTIPLFEGFASGYRVAQAQAQADGQEAALHALELQVSLEVWRSYQRLRTDTLNLDNSKALLADAGHALTIARGRYRAGVGTFTELLNAQAALADAQKQRVLAVSKWRTARLRLAASLGDLGLWSAR